MISQLDLTTYNESAQLARRERMDSDCNSCLTLYLREIGKVKRLTPEEEIQLAKRIQDGDQDAREEMIKANLRLVVKIARDYENIGVPLMDLISEGNIGLMKAVERFDPAKGAKLSTYSSWWIKQSIKRALANQSKTIRLPVHIVHKISRMNQTARRLLEELGREPTDEELAEEMSIPASQVARMRMTAMRPASLDARMGDSDSEVLGDVIEDERAEIAPEALEEKTQHRDLREMIESLNGREAGILRARFGLDGRRRKTLAETADQLGLTRERVRQLQNRALTKLRKKLNKPGRPQPGPQELIQHCSQN